jgi:hypothetical protein
VDSEYEEPLTITVTDANGNPINDQAVNFSVVAGTSGASASFVTGGSSASITTSSTGVATTPDLTANGTAGTFTVSATIQGYNGNALFTLTNEAGSPYSIAKGSGASQTTTVGTAFAVPLSVTVTDQNKNVVSGVAVTFTSPSTGASGVFAGASNSVTVTTDSNGVAVAPTFVANHLAGGYAVLISVTGLDTSTAFSMVNEDGSAASTGYWVVTSTGGVYNYGIATSYGSLANLHLNAPIVGMAATADGKGYWLVASDGGVFSFGDAQFYGSTGGQQLNAPVVGITASSDGGGYLLVASDGGVFTYGDAQFAGSGAGSGDNQVRGIALNPVGGYWIVDASGDVVGFGGAVAEAVSGTSGSVAGITASP